MTVPFEKMHGLGNDFVLVRADAIADLDVVARVPDWCDRHRGVGADGIIVLFDESDVGLRMAVHNADGSTPEICGNGIRCAVLSWAARRGLERGEAVVETDAGAKRCQFGGGRVTVDMGPGRLDHTHLPARADQLGPARVAVEVAGQPMTGLAVSMGNPHLVLFAAQWPAIEARIAAPLEHHPAFPQRANVSFATEPLDGRARVTVWERGVGFTQACGTAACATAVAAAATGRLEHADPALLSVELPGGALEIAVSADLSRVEMTGPAELVYVGEISPNGAPD